MAKKAKTADICVTGNGTIYLIGWVSKAGKQWMNDNLPEDAQRLGESIAVEHRFISDIVQGMVNDGLVVDKA